MRSTERAASGLALLLALIGLYQGANVLTDHLASPDFPEHARFHAALGGAYMILISGLTAWIAWVGHLRRAMAGLLLPAVLLFVPVGYLVAIAIVPAGSPGGGYTALAVFAVVLALVVAALLRTGQRPS